MHSPRTRGPMRSGLERPHAAFLFLQVVLASAERAAYLTEGCKMMLLAL